MKHNYFRIWFGLVIGGLLMGLFLLVSCKKDIYDPNAHYPSPMPDLQVNPDFDWQITQNAALEAIANDVYEGKYYYEISVYTSNPLNHSDARLITKGLAKKGNPFLADLTLPKGIEEVYVCQLMKMKDGTERKLMKVIPIKEGKALCDFTNASYEEESDIPEAKSITATNTSDDAGNIKVPGNAIEIKGNSFRIETKKVYVVKAGTTFTGVLDWDWCQGTEIYVEGTLTPSNGQDINGKATIYVMPEGTFKSSRLLINSNSRFNNYGETEIASLQIDNPGSIFSNYGHLKVNNLVMTSNSQFFNYCFTEVTELCDIQGNRDFIVGSEGLLLCKKLKMNNSTINLDRHAILNVTSEANFISGNQIHAKDNTPGETTTALALLPAFKAGWGGLTLQGRLEVFFRAGNSYDKNYIDIKKNVTIAASEEATMEIPSSGCNGDGNNDAGGPSDPGGSDYPIIVAPDNGYTLLMEDYWPVYGDYDMNDIVMDIKTAYTDQGTYIENLMLTIKLRAIGAWKQLAAAVQLDQVASENVISVEDMSAGRLLDNSVFVCSNGLENDQPWAVVPFFDDAHLAMGTILHEQINTIPKRNTLKQPEYQIKITFKPQMVKQEDIQINKLNFFLVTNGLQRNRIEVHLRGFEPTALANRGYLDTGNDNYSVAPYSSNDNLIWGLLVPADEKGNTFAYPAEYWNIQKVYPKFVTWANSNGAEELDWYKAENANSDYLYK